MPFKTDKEIDLTEEIDAKYIISSQHRKKGHPDKSVWTISFNEEVECFIQTMAGNWKVECEAWGIQIVDKVIQVLGENTSGRELKLAKFVDGTHTNVWHGYPADYLRKAQDRPPTNVLKLWVDSGYLTKPKMSKIRLGQPCNL